MTPRTMLPGSGPGLQLSAEARILHVCVAMSILIDVLFSTSYISCMIQHTDLPPSRAAAKAAGSKHYFTGKPCSKGHITLRHLTGTCVDCQQEANSRWSAKNPGAHAEYSRQYYLRHPERVKANGLRSKRKAMGIPDATRPKPLTCEMCDAGGRQMHLDHDHATGKFRGWLCNRCNMALGVLGDTVANLERAIDYLRRNGSS